MKLKVCIITGTPGTGKTHLTKIISKVPNIQAIFLSDLISKEKHHLDFDDERETWIANVKTLIPRLKEIIKNIRKKEIIELVIIEGHFSDIVPSKVINYAIVLRCHPDELVKRLEKRGYKDSKIRENVQAEILGECLSYLLKKKKRIPIMEIDTTRGDFEGIASNLTSIFWNEKKYENYVLGSIDWLEELFKANRLKEFFD